VDPPCEMLVPECAADCEECEIIQKPGQCPLAVCKSSPEVKKIPQPICAMKAPECDLDCEDCEIIERPGSCPYALCKSPVKIN
jgi:hypothetical protein